MPRRPMDYLSRGDIPKYGFGTGYDANNPTGAVGTGMGWDMPSYYDAGVEGQPQAWHPDMLGGNAPYNPANYGSGMALGQSPYTPSYGMGGDGTTPITPGGSFFGGNYSGFGGDMTSLSGASQGLGSLYEHARSGLGEGGGGSYFGNVNPYSSTQSYLETGAPGYAPQAYSANTPGSFAGAAAPTGGAENYGSYRATGGAGGSAYDTSTGTGAPSLFYGGGGYEGTQGVDPWSNYFSKEDIGKDLKPGEAPGYGQAWSDLISSSIGSDEGTQGAAEQRASAYLSMPESFGTAGMNMDSDMDPSKLYGASKVDLSNRAGVKSLVSPFLDHIPSDAFAKTTDQLKGFVEESFYDVPEDVDLSTYGKGYETGEKASIDSILENQRLGSTGPEAKRGELAGILANQAGKLQSSMFGTGTGIIPSELEARTSIQGEEAGDIAEFDMAREEMIGDASAGTGFLGEREERWQDYIDDYNKQVKRGQKDVKESKSDLAETEQDIEADLSKLRSETLPSRRKIRGFEGGGLRSGRRNRVGDEERTKLNLERTELERQRTKAIDLARREQTSTRDEFGRQVEDIGALRDEETAEAEAEIIEEGPILAEDKLSGIMGRREQMTGDTGAMSVPKALQGLEEMYTGSQGISDTLAAEKEKYNPASDNLTGYRGAQEQALAGGGSGTMLDSIIGDPSGGGRSGFVTDVQNQFGTDGQLDLSTALKPDWFGGTGGGYDTGRMDSSEKRDFLRSAQPFQMFGEKYNPIAQYSNWGQAGLDVGWQDEARPGYAKEGVAGGGWGGRTHQNPWWNWNWSPGKGYTIRNDRNTHYRIPQFTHGGWGDVDTSGSDSKGYTVIPHGKFDDSIKKAPVDNTAEGGGSWW